MYSFQFIRVCFDSLRLHTALRPLFHIPTVLIHTCTLSSLSSVAPLVAVLFFLFFLFFYTSRDVSSSPSAAPARRAARVDACNPEIRKRSKKDARGVASSGWTWEEMFCGVCCFRISALEPQEKAQETDPFPTLPFTSLDPSERHGCSWWDSTLRVVKEGTKTNEQDGGERNVTMRALDRRGPKGARGGAGGGAEAWRIPSTGGDKESVAEKRSAVGRLRSAAACGEEARVSEERTRAGEHKKKTQRGEREEGRETRRRQE